MDTELVGKLRADLENSTREALSYAAAWRHRRTTLAMQYGAESHQFHIVKRDDLRLKEYMSSYEWHRDHVTFCTNAIQMLGL